MLQCANVNIWNAMVHYARTSDSFQKGILLEEHIGIGIQTRQDDMQPRQHVLTSLRLQLCQSWLETRHLQPFRNATLALPVSPRSARLGRVAREERGAGGEHRFGFSFDTMCASVHSAASSRASAFCRFAITAGSFM